MSNYSDEENLIDLSKALGQDIKKLESNIGDLSKLSTNDKTSIVKSLNELKALVDSGTGGGGGSGSNIDDTAGEGNKTSTWSADKIIAYVSIKLAPMLVDLEETTTALDNIANSIQELNDNFNGAVRYDVTQDLTSEQKIQACENIGLDDPTVDLLEVYTYYKNGPY